MIREPVFRPPDEPGPRLSRKHLLWVIPLGAAVVAVMIVAALPKFVASGYHRTTIEGLASSLTGRNVHIAGKLSLALLPHPQFIAGNVTITSPDQETITAASLTLDIAPIPLLRGQILARSLTLQSPHIALPWPLPGGAAAIAPPRWLTALHAQISDGVVSLGNITFTNVSADIFTGSDGAFSVSGSGNLAGYPLDLSLGFGALSAVGSTPITVNLQTDSAPRLQAHISGSYDSSSTLTGKASLNTGSLASLDPSLAAPVAGTADITADSSQIGLTNLSLRQGKAALFGSATLALSQPLLTLLVSGQALSIPLGHRTLAAIPTIFSILPTHLALDATSTQFTGTGSGDDSFIAVPHLHCIVDFGADGATIASFNAALAGDSTLSLAGTLNAAGGLQAKAIFNTPGISAFLSAYGAGIALPAAWQEASLAGNVSGTADRLSLANLSGNLGPARVTGTAILAVPGNAASAQPRNLVGALHFDQLDLTPFAAMLRNPPNGFGAHNALTGDFEISADRASIDKISLAHLLVDASLGSQLVVRRLTASLWGGIASASFTLSPNPAQSTPNHPQTGFISAAQAVLALPSATPLAALLPPQLALPATLIKAPLAFSFQAAGPATALATSASLTLGAIDITAAPVIDLTRQTAAGAFTLRHPDAIAAFKAFGLNAGWAWPGAGSIALRASMLLSPTQMGLTDFVLSMGDLTANGRLIYSQDHQLNGEIDADTLALPPIAANAPLPWAYLATTRGKITISANHVLWGGNQVLGATSGNLVFGTNRIALAITQANLANGVLKADISAIATPAQPPAKATLPVVTGKFTLIGADNSQLDLPLNFPITLPTGSLDVAGDLTASGYAPQAWLATLAGSASLAAQSGSLAGFNLPDAVTALNAKNHRMTLLRVACLAGATPFTQLSLTGDFASGIYTLANGTLQSPAGTATASGSIDFPDAGMGVNIVLLPAVPAPPQLGLSLAGSWAGARKTIDLKPALAWKPPAVPPTAH